MKDVSVVYWEATKDVVRIIGDWLHKKGYTVDLLNGRELSDVPLVDNDCVVLPVVSDDCAKGVGFGKATVVPVWPNNCARPTGLDMPFSTLDMGGTLFDKSLEKVCERFPKWLKDKNANIRGMMKYDKWPSFLCEHPELEDLCPFDMIDGAGWVYTLKEQPRFASKCDWGKLSGSDWKTLLCEKPEFASQCDWGKLDGCDWAHLLAERPDLRAHCDWTKFKSLDCDYWVELLSKQPIADFAVRCDFSKFNSREWVSLLEIQPNFADRCDWEMFDGGDWARLLVAQPQFADRCDWSKLESQEWAFLLAERPEFAERCAWRILTGHELGELLCKRPEFAAYCDLWKLDGNDWRHLLAAHPEFVQQCDWRQLTGWDWTELLYTRPEFAQFCDWRQLGPGNWERLLERHPQFVDKCGLPNIRWERFPDLLKLRKDLVRRCDWAKLHFDTIRAILKAFPEYGALVDLDRFSNEQLKDLAAVGVSVPRRVMCEVQKDNDLKEACENPADIYICSEPAGSVAAQRLAAALEKRQYAVTLNEIGSSEEMERSAIDAAKFFLLVRTKALFAGIIDQTSPVYDALEYAIDSGKRIVSVGPSDQSWQDARHLPGKFSALEIGQVKNLNMGDLFEETVDALVRESLKGERGSLAKRYDVFISYRRATGTETARRLQQQLRAMGYLTFLDYDCILNGRYDRVIRSALESAPVFISLLTDHSLDRCSETGDWVAEELRMAMDQHKCLVPIAPGKKKWIFPSTLPEDLAPLRELKVSRLATDGDFVSSLEKIARRFPSEVRAKAKEIRAVIQNPDRTKPISEPGRPPLMLVDGDWKRWPDERTLLTGVLKKWPDAISLFPCEEFGSGEWSLIMRDVPVLAQRCDWRKIDTHDILDILKERPELAGWMDLGQLRGWEWGCLLRGHPEFADICEWRKFTGEDWNLLWRNNPKIAKQYEGQRDWSRMNAKDWVDLLKERPQFADKCDWGRLEGLQLVELLRKRPDLAKHAFWHDMRGDDWVTLLIVQPLLSRYCHEWYKLDGSCWATLLCQCPWFADKCDWFKLSKDDWEALLTVQPQFFDACKLDFVDSGTYEEIKAFHRNHPAKQSSVGVDETRASLVRQFEERIEGCDCEDAEVDGECLGFADVFSFGVLLKGRHAPVYVCGDLLLEEDSTIVSGIEELSLHNVLGLSEEEDDYIDAPEVEDLDEIKYVLGLLAKRFKDSGEHAKPRLSLSARDIFA